MDFTVNKHHSLLLAFKNEGYSFQSVFEFIQKQSSRVIILRYDVEKHYENALKFAQIQSRHEIKATYYFRFSHRYYNESIIKEIADLGHEIGYHYDDLSKCNGNYNCAICSGH